MTVRLLVLGGNGLLGHHVWGEALSDSRFEVKATVRENRLGSLPSGYRPSATAYDVRDEPGFEEIVGTFSPQAVINCAGITKHIQANPEEAIFVNSLAPHRLARICAGHGSRLVHISTDCVFAGSKGNYSEDDLPDPPDVYGRSKLLGEVSSAPHITLRTSFVGRELDTKYGLLEWFLSQKGEINGYRQAIWSGLGAPALARLLLEVALRPDLTGLWHVGGESIDKYHLLLKLKETFGKDDVEIKPVDEPMIDRSLDSRRFADTGLSVPSMAEMIAELAGGKHVHD